MFLGPKKRESKLYDFFNLEVYFPKKDKFDPRRALA